MTKDRNKSVPASYLLLRKGEKILLMRREGSGYYDGWYSVPAGHVEAGELPIDALVRETKEELGIILGNNDVRLVHTMYRTKHDETGDRVDLFFEAAKWTGEITNTEPHKCDDVRWFSIDSLPKNIMHHVREAIENIENGISYSELGLDRIVRNPSKATSTKTPH